MSVEIHDVPRNGKPELTQEQRAQIETAEDKARRVTREPLVYQQVDNRRSYFADLVMAERGDGPASERLRHHQHQMRDMPRSETRMVGAEFEHRVNPNTTAGTGGEFAPPLWLNELFATARRPGQVIQRLAHTFDMPAGVSSVNLTRITQGTEGSNAIPGGPAPNQDVETSPAKSKAIEFAGNSDWSVQALEQSAPGASLDWVVFTDLTESVDADIEAQCISGNGEATEELLGLLNIKGINSITNSGSVAPKEVFVALAKAMAAVGKERKRMPDAWLMGTARLAWLALTTDTNEQRPLVLVDNIGELFPAASLAAVALYPDDAITRTLVSEKEEIEPVFCVRSDDFLMWLSSPRTMVMRDVLSGSLGVRFQLRRTVAAILGRYPSGISAVVGKGMKPESGF